MVNTITELWYGNLEPIQNFGKNNPQIKELENLLQRNLDKLESILTEKENKIFKNYTDCINEYLLVTSEQAFYDGFCLGTKIAAEALTAYKNIV